MNIDDLLQLSPELLAKAVLHRRQQLLGSLPNSIETLQDEVDFTTPLSQNAKKRRDKKNAHVAVLKKERNIAKTAAYSLVKQAQLMREKLLQEGKLRSLNPSWAKQKLQIELENLEQELQIRATDHKQEQKYLLKMKELVIKHEKEVEKRARKNPELGELHEIQSKIRKLFEEAEKSHQAMLELVLSGEENHIAYAESEERRRLAASRLNRAISTLEESEIAVAYWERRLKDGFADLGGVQFQNLLFAAERVKQGGKSTIAIKREKLNYTKPLSSGSTKSIEEE